MSSDSQSGAPSMRETAPIEAELRIAEIEARLTAISTVPWCLDERYPRMVYCDDSLGSIVANCDAESFGSLRLAAKDANAAFVANAPTDIAWLVAELRAARSSSLSSEPRNG